MSTRNTIVLRQFQAASPSSELMGIAFNAFFESVLFSEVEPFLANYGLRKDEPVPEWVPQQMALDILKNIYDSGKNSVYNIVAVGMKVTTVIDLPPHINSVETALDFLPMFYKGSHRNIPDEEGWRIEKIGPNHIHAYQNSPYPNDNTYGMLYGLVQRFKGDDLFVVRRLREGGIGDSPTTSLFEIKWGPTEKDVA